MDWKDFIDDMSGNLRELNKTIPDTTKGFSALTRGAMDNGVLDHKVKELIALGIAIAMRCEPCIGFHIKSLARTGATREEMADVLAVAVQMGGGPSLMYAAKSLAAWDELVGEKA
ncbi:carboxymuconolactone decarboxylase family protein [Tropicimonas sp. IMCC34043]|uniref:carboxymuconolactone decarboxylase family protein n=1 Tax=Tropicimonas sp. IMCC34043 TaxID=2248760 RepID=UPI000E22DC50|nr:carboxymuconolactone decarboxylase family protein [Tropicimonas sp. IMCC34043]